MNTFHDKNIIFFKTHFVSLKIADSGMKIVCRKLNFLSVEQIHEVLVEHFDVEGFKAFIVVVTEFILWSFLPSYIVVVKTYEFWIKSQCLQLQ